MSVTQFTAPADASAPSCRQSLEDTFGPGLLEQLGPEQSAPPASAALRQMAAERRTRAKSACAWLKRNLLAAAEKDEAQAAALESASRKAAASAAPVAGPAPATKTQRPHKPLTPSAPLTVTREPHALRIEARPSHERPRLLVLQVQLRPYGALMTASVWIDGAVVASVPFTPVKPRPREGAWRLSSAPPALVLNQLAIPLTRAEHAALLKELGPLAIELQANVEAAGCQAGAL